ncbi:DHS-like NAD/FAD-binding domain-containing protein [Whalleya microplaca]|nr:DHS-like NAD/FAD-binding domain-containing protein [Whalleya microplaca]
MPTVQVKPTSSDLLQDVADSLGKARKVVIISGAGISTNSGIPDFRSENGLYSLIQAQFERAEASRVKDTSEESSDFQISERPAKRRRTSQTAESAEEQEPGNNAQVSDDPRSRDETDSTAEHPKESSLEARDGLSSKQEALSASEELSQRLTRSKSGLRPPIPRHMTEYSSQSSTSQDSIFSNPQLSEASSQTEDSAPYPAMASPDFPTRTTTPKRVVFGETFSSSPLSSPPPVLFDPYENTITSTDSSSQASPESSDSSDSEDTQPSLDFLSSQSSTSSLRNMKGRDLFDSNIWADPLKTSVFYRFATTLRQKVKEVEPTTTHRFIAQLRDVGKLARVYTQNIDEIEKKIGLSTDLKVGAGNRRRKSAKQQLADLEKDTKEKQESMKAEDDPGGIDTGQASQSSQSSEVPTRSAVRLTSLQDKGVECVFLHGSLHALRCFVCGKLCNWDEDGRESCTLLGEQPECPHCAGATAARQEKGKRALGVGKLRPDIVLYGEEHPQSDLISPIVQHDLSSNPDLLLVLGTSLRVHGLKVMVKEFAKAVHTKGGKVVFINFTKPSESAWGDIIDYWVEWDCDAWVDDLKDRKPHLWLSPEEILELEKQKREALAEKKRESITKKRESLGEKRRHTIEATKLRPPPKNPSAMRNDYQCGAYVVWDIFQSLAKIGDRPFDNLGYTPPRHSPPAASSPSPIPPVKVPKVTPVPPPVLPLAATAGCRPTVKAKRARKSAPAAIKATADPELKSRPAIKAKFLTSCDTKNQYTKAAQGLARTGKSPTPVRLAQLNRAPTPREKPTTPPYEAPSSITAAVKVNPRQRKRKVITDITYERKAPPAVKRTLPLPKSLDATRRESVPGSGGGLGPAFPTTHTTNTNTNANNTTTLPPKGPVLPPFHPGWEHSPPAKIKPMEPHLNVSPQSPLADVVPPIALTRPPTARGPAPARSSSSRVAHFPMFFSDPLVRLPYETTNYHRRPPPPKHPHPRASGGGVADDDQKTPSPSDQLRWELAQHEALEGAQALEGLRRSGQ